MTWIIVDSFLSEDMRSRSPDKRYPRAHIVDVAALRLPHVISHEKMHIGRDPAHVAVELPLGTDLGRRDDVARAAFRRQFQVSRRAVHAIMRRVPPDHVAPERHEHVVSGQQLQGGMNINEVARADEAGVIEISRLEIEWIKSTKCTASVTGVTINHVELQSQTGLQRRVGERVSAGRADRPGTNVASTEMSDLDDRLYIVVESVRFAKHPCAEGLSHLFAGTSSIAGVLVLETKVIEIGFKVQRRAERGSRDIDAPEQLAGELIIEGVFLFAGGLRHERIDLPTCTAPYQLQSIELERDV